MPHLRLLKTIPKFPNSSNRLLQHRRHLKPSQYQVKTVQRMPQLEKDLIMSSNIRSLVIQCQYPRSNLVRMGCYLRLVVRLPFPIIYIS